MRMLLTVAVMLMLHAGAAHAQVMKEYRYVSDGIYPIRTGLGLTTMIELSASENVQDYSLGFTSAWDVSRRGNVFYLRPKSVDADTNMVVRTETHAYIFELKVVAGDWRELDQAKASGVNYKVVFQYPGDNRFTQAAKDKPAEAGQGLQPGRGYHFDYEYATRSRAAWLIPVHVYDDGRFTYIELGDMRGQPTGNFPAVYARERERSEEFALNTTVQGNTIVVHGVYPYLLVRQGGNVIGLRRGGAK